MLEAQHVDHRHLRDHGAEEIGSLQHRRRREQAAVRTTSDPECLGGGDAFGEQVLTAGDQIVEHLLLVAERPLLVPRLTVLGAASKVGDDDDAARLEERKSGRAVGRGEVDREAAVAVQLDRSRERRISATDDEHADLGAVGRHSMQAFHDQIGRIDRRLAPRPHLGDTVLCSQDGGRLDERLIAEEDGRFGEAAREPGDRAEPREGKRTELGAVGRVAGESSGGLDEVVEQQLARESRRPLERMLGLRHQRDPCVGIRRRKIDGDDAPVRGVAVGLHEKAAVVAVGNMEHDVVGGDTSFDQPNPCSRIDGATGRDRVAVDGQVEIQQAIAPIGAEHVGEHQVAQIFGELDHVDGFGVGVVVEDERIVGLLGADAVVVHRGVLHRCRRPGFGLGPAHIEEAIAQPGDAREPQMIESVGEILPAVGATNSELLTVTARLGEQVREETAVVGQCRTDDRHGTVVGQRVRIKQDDRFGSTVLDPVGRLVGEAVVVAPHHHPVGAFPPHLRRFRAGNVPQFGHALDKPGPVGKPGEIRTGDGVLGGDEVGGLVRVEVLEPPIRVGDLAPVVEIDHITSACGGIGEGHLRRLVRGARRPIVRPPLPPGDPC